MADFKTCSNGHNYDGSKHPICPYCPSSKHDNDYDQNLLDFQKTVLLDESGNNQFGKTILSEENSDLEITKTGSGITPHPLGRTMLIQDEGIGNQSITQHSERKQIVGWLVTFSLNQFGDDYRLFVGKNRIGSASSCDIVINDPSISGEHTTVLFRENEFLFKDSFSTNGTKVNGVMAGEGKLKDGDELRLGNVTFKFKTIF